MARMGCFKTALALGTTLIAGATAWGGGGDLYPARYNDYFEVTARGGMLIGEEGRTGDSLRYRGRDIWSGPGTATVLVREKNNTGIVTGTVRAKGHTYTVLMNTFGGDRPFQSGGIAKFVNLHGLTKQGAPILPEVFAYLAGWGSHCTVWKDADVLYDDFECHFMLTEAVRDPESGEIPGFPDKEQVREWMQRRDKTEIGDAQDIRNQILASGQSGLSGVQLHLFAHSPEQNTSNLPPYEAAMHFLWTDVQWRGGPQLSGAHRPYRWSDEDIARTIRAEFKANERIDLKNVDVQVKNGRVTLKGVADDTFVKNRAYLSAWVPGVKSVRNELQVKRNQQVSDQELQRAITEAYALDPRIVHSRPTVQVKDGIATLKGTVASRHAKHAAETVARQFAGVSDVRNRLKIDDSLPKGEPSDLDAIVLLDVEPVKLGLSKRDYELERDIESELTWSPYVDADNVDVIVSDGVAVLFGTVEDRSEMEAAIRNAFEAGAGRVENQLIIQGS